MTAQSVGLRCPPAQINLSGSGNAFGRVSPMEFARREPPFAIERAAEAARSPPRFRFVPQPGLFVAGVEDHRAVVGDHHQRRVGALDFAGRLPARVPDEPQGDIPALALLAVGMCPSSGIM